MYIFFFKSDKTDGLLKHFNSNGAVCKIAGMTPKV